MFSKVFLPWHKLIEDNWLVVGMNHYRIDGEIHLFISMSKGDRCIKSEGTSEAAIFGEMCSQARAVNNAQMIEASS